MNQDFQPMAVLCSHSNPFFVNILQSAAICIKASVNLHWQSGQKLSSICMFSLFIVPRPTVSSVLLNVNMDTAIAASRAVFVSETTSRSLGPESWANSIKLMDLMENAVTDFSGVDLNGSLKLACYGVGITITNSENLQS